MVRYVLIYTLVSACGEQTESDQSACRHPAWFTSTSVTGTRGVAEFRCASPSDLCTAVMTGAELRILAKAKRGEDGLRLVSMNPGIASVGDTSMELAEDGCVWHATSLTALAPGAASIGVEALDGTILDFTTWQVDVGERLSLRPRLGGAVRDQSLVLVTDERALVDVVGVSADGGLLHAGDHAMLRLPMLTDPAIIELLVWSDTLQDYEPVTVAPSGILVEGVSAGSTILRAETGPRTADIDVLVLAR